MIDERLGLAIGQVLRDVHRPPSDLRVGVETVMAEIRGVRQLAGASRLPVIGRIVSDRPDRLIARPGTVRRSRGIDRSGGTRTMFSASRLFLAGVGVVLLGGFVAWGSLAPEGVGPGAGSPAPTGIAWTTERVTLTADGLELTVNDLTFGNEASPTTVDSDPGHRRYWTLEAYWTEHDVGQRLYMYFGSDGIDWWVDEIRTYDGHESGEWVYADGPFFRSRLGEAFEGDVRIELLGKGRPGDDDNHVPATLAIEDMRLSVTPGTNRPPPEDTRDRPSRRVIAVERAVSKAIGESSGWR